jgi:hypothetical protein
MSIPSICGCEVHVSEGKLQSASLRCGECAHGMEGGGMHVLPAKGAHPPDVTKDHVTQDLVQGGAGDGRRKVRR